MPLSNCTVFTGNDENMSIVPFIRPQFFLHNSLEEGNSVKSYARNIGKLLGHGSKK